MKKGYTIIELISTIMVLGILALMISALVFLVKGCNHVADKGLKNVVTEVWEGPATNTVPVVTNTVDQK